MTYRNLITALIVGMVAVGAANAQQAPAADKKAPAPQQQAKSEAKSEAKPDSGAKKASKKSSKSSKAKIEAKKDSTKVKKG